MGYDIQSQMWDQPATNCTARSNSPVRDVAAGVRAYLRLGVDPDKLVLGVPWYGYSYQCLELEGNACKIRCLDGVKLAVATGCWKF